MTSLQIQYFLKVADCMSFSQAADELYDSGGHGVPGQLPPLAAGF